MFRYMLKAEYVTLVRLKVPSGKQPIPPPPLFFVQTNVGNLTWYLHPRMPNSRMTLLWSGEGIREKGIGGGGGGTDGEEA